MDCLDDQYCFETYCLEDVCTAGDSYCDGLGVVECNADGSGEAVTKTCTDEQYCEDGQCQDQSCPPGQVYCDGDLLLTCDAIGKEVVETVDCAAKDEHCVNGGCQPGVCDANTSSCDGNTVMQCDATGTELQEVKTCGEGQYCGEDGDAAACADQECVPNEKTCQGTKVMECDDVGAGEKELENCADGGEVCTDGECVELSCGALSFDGLDDQVEIAHSTSLNLSSSVTIAVWFQSGGVANYENIIRKGNAHSSYFMWLKPPMKLEYGIYTGSVPHVANGTSSLEADQWYHFVMTYDGETVRGYLNGVPHGTADSPSGSFNDNELPVRIGYGYPALWNNDFFSGKIDEVAIWSTALGEQAIADSLLLGIDPGQEPNLVGLWTFDEEEGSIASDTSGNGNDGTLSGTTWFEADSYVP